MRAQQRDILGPPLADLNLVRSPWDKATRRDAQGEEVRVMRDRSGAPWPKLVVLVPIPGPFTEKQPHMKKSPEFH